MGIKLCVGDPVEFAAIVQACIKTGLYLDFIVREITVKDVNSNLQFIRLLMAVKVELELPLWNLQTTSDLLLMKACTWSTICLLAQASAKRLVSSQVEGSFQDFPFFGLFLLAPIPSTVQEGSCFLLAASNRSNAIQTLVQQALPRKTQN